VWRATVARPRMALPFRFLRRSCTRSPPNTECSARRSYDGNTMLLQTRCSDKERFHPRRTPQAPRQSPQSAEPRLATDAFRLLQHVLRSCRSSSGRVSTCSRPPHERSRKARPGVDNKGLVVRQIIRLTAGLITIERAASAVMTHPEILSFTAQAREVPFRSALRIPRRRRVQSRSPLFPAASCVKATFSETAKPLRCL